MAKRKTLSKKTRFEVFKRDSFKCQYCGACAPEAILVVDHIDPVSKDGADEMVNYITACQPCNAGKSDRKLDDSTTLQKQKAQLDELNQRREQLEMMMQWRSGLKEINELQLDEAYEAWREVAPGWSLNEKGMKELRGYVKKYGLSKVLDAIDVVKEQYIVVAGDEPKATQESVNKGWSKLGGVLAMASMPESERELHYIKGILRNRLSYVPYDAFKRLKYALEDGVTLDDLRLEAKNARTWSSFEAWLVEAREDARG
ncbi:MAG TPA: HNH endonuclease [Prosthecobacter sp.]|nr:HNH endonuclease [Prosthecobacter sp.]